ncbi:MAG: hypothetical protein D6808_05450 [Candidatus Dadabacteria bacterium]|nr:MAG: hypothetical protein D6808_05450 [Candidatus Dadabacteria bacterium]
MKSAIEGRELGKFMFTRSLSEVLELVAELGGKMGFSRHDLADLNIQVLLGQYSKVVTRDIKDIIKEDIEKNRLEYMYTQAIELPQVILSQKDIYQFFSSSVEPNFITRLKVVSEVVPESHLHCTDLKGKIVVVQSADPGYDWLFSREIGGLVTMYGGVNSHMAIRCSELDIPAVIGCGESNYSRWSSFSCLEIDCENKKVSVVE